jgi:serine O-acetyltransferase
MRVVREIVRDTVAIARWFGGGSLKPREVRTAILHDGLQVLILARLRQAAERSRVPLVAGVVRRLQTSLFGIEIAHDVQLGEGVFFMHTVGIVLGGNSQVGDRVMFFGGNTLGALDGGYPRVGNDVVVGAGARVLGPVTIGDGASIGANAVVLCDVPAGATAVGVPAVVRPGAAPRTGSGQHSQ